MIRQRACLFAAGPGHRQLCFCNYTAVETILVALSISWQLLPPIGDPST
jgi:hypothetical protein